MKEQMCAKINVRCWRVVRTRLQTGEEGTKPQTNQKMI